jgi:hypothetical protein
MEHDNVLSNEVIFSAGSVKLIIPKEASFFDREERRSRMPVANFGIVVPNRLYRGGWSCDLSWMGDYGIRKVVSLWEDPNEKVDLDKLRHELEQLNISHVDSPLKSLQAYLEVAQFVAEQNVATYVHCRAGANRTSMVILLSQILLRRHDNYLPSQNDVREWLKQSLRHGFDFDKRDNMQMMENLLAISLGNGWWVVE